MVFNLILAASLFLNLFFAFRILGDAELIEIMEADMRFLEETLDEAGELIAEAMRDREVDDSAD